MTFLAPWALWFGIVGAAIVGLYILKIKRQRQLVPALDFWRQLAGRTKVHSLFDRLKRLLSMLLWLAIATCLVFALGNPILSLGRVKPQSIAVIIDNSASMQAREGDNPSDTRLGAALAALGDISSRRPVSDNWLLIEAAREPRVLVPWTHDRKAMEAATESMKPFNGHGDLRAAVELAAQLLDGKTEPLILIISDGDHGTVDELKAKDERIVHWPIGSTRDNLGITRLAVRLHPQQSNHHALISVANETTEAIDTQVTLSIDGRTHSVELVHVDPEGVWEKTIVIDAPDGGVLQAHLDRDDALVIDNEAYAILQPIRPAAVWLVSPKSEAFFFEQALSAMDPLIDAERSLTMTLEQFDAARAALAKAGTTKVNAPDLVLFNNCAPKQLPATGRFIIVNALPADIPAQDIGSLVAPRMFLAPREHPLTQYLSLNGVRVKESRRLRLTDRANVLAQTADGDPLIFLHEQPNRQALVLAFDVLESDLPFRNAFPLLLRNAVAFMHLEAPSWLKSNYAIGEQVTPLRALPPGTESVALTVQHGGKTDAKTIPVRADRFSYADTNLGMALRATVGDDAAYAAVNLCNEDETRIGIAEAELPSERLALSRTLFGTMPWIAFAVIAALLIVLEWLTYSFRWTE